MADGEWGSVAGVYHAASVCARAHARQKVLMRDLLPFKKIMINTTVVSLYEDPSGAGRRELGHNMHGGTYVYIYREIDMCKCALVSIY